jgi:hypothetical protein
MKQTKYLLGQPLAKDNMKKLKGGTLVPLPYNWSCTSGPEYWCGFDKDQCVANCPSGVCRSIKNCL